MKKAFVVILTFLFIFSVNFLFDGDEAVTTFSEMAVTPKIIIDAGHGGLTNTIN